ncbi:MAG: hypothetical protein AB7I68_10310 [Porticoccaceae bacterium]
MIRVQARPVRRLRASRTASTTNQELVNSSTVLMAPKPWFSVVWD